MLHYLAQLTVDVPDIQPDFSAPFFGGLQVLLSYLLAVSLLVAIAMLTLAITAVASKSHAPDRVREWAGARIIVIFVATSLLGSVSGIFQWFVNFDFGFGSL